MKILAIPMAFLNWISLLFRFLLDLDSQSVDKPLRQTQTLAGAGGPPPLDELKKSPLPDNNSPDR